MVSVVGFCLFAIGFAADLEEQFRHLNEIMEKVEYDNINMIERDEIERKLARIVKFHGESKEFSIDLKFSN